MFLTTKRLILRNFKMEDWERVHLYAADPLFSQYELWGPNTEEDTKKYIAAMVDQAASYPRHKFDFAVCLKEDDLLIGGCGIRRETELSQVANLGWAINPEFQCQGYATEAAKALINYGFQDLNLLVIYATCDAENVASYTVMQRLGMSRVGLTSGTTPVKGSVRDTYRYEIINRLSSSRVGTLAEKL
jgi:RimJ/RimL family protein N-acetyltransferase